MPDVHRPGRIGRDVFDVDLLALPDVAAAVIHACGQHDAQLLAPDMRFEREIDETGTGDVDLGDKVVAAQRLGDFFGEIARLLTGILGQHHGGVGGKIAMARIARRLDHHAGTVVTHTSHGKSRTFTRSSMSAKRCWGVPEAGMVGVRVMEFTS